MILSIIIPAYNMDKYVESCLDSIYYDNVDDRHFEVIIVNDGSKDNTLQVSLNYAKSKSNLTVIDQPNAGVSAARNKGIANARGKYVTFVDADDYIVAGSLAKVVDRIYNMEATTDLIYLRAHLNPSGKECTSWIKRVSSDITFQGISLFEKVGLIHTVWACFYRRDFLVANNLKFAVGVRNSEDTIFMTECQICANNATFWMIPFYIYNYREDSAYNNVSNEKLESYKIGLEYSRNIFEKYDTRIGNTRALLNENLYLYIANTTIASILCPFGSMRRMLCEFHINSYLPIENSFGSVLKYRIMVLNASYMLYYVIMSLVQKKLKLYNKWK